MKNIEKYKDDLNTLIETGTNLDFSIKYSCYPDNIEKQLKEALKANINIGIQNH